MLQIRRARGAQLAPQVTGEPSSGEVKVDWNWVPGRGLKPILDHQLGIGSFGYAAYVHRPSGSRRKPTRGVIDYDEMRAVQAMVEALANRQVACDGNWCYAGG